MWVFFSVSDLDSDASFAHEKVNNVTLSDGGATNTHCDTNHTKQPSFPVESSIGGKISG